MDTIASQVAEGMDVYDAADEKIGTVQDVYDAAGGTTKTSGGGYLRVPTGFLGLGEEHHIPFSAIRDVRDGNIFLSFPKDRLNELGYDEGPSAVGVDQQRLSDERTATTSRTPAVTTEPVGGSAETARKLQLREEELIARKRSVETGAVNLRTEVVSEQRTLEVPVTREEVTVERHAVDRRPSDRPIGQEETISVPVREEQVTVDKQAVVYEEVSLGKRAVQETQHVSDTVRREEAVIDKEGEVDVQGETKTPNHGRP